MLEALDLRLLACHHVLLEDLSEDLLEASGSRQMIADGRCPQILRKNNIAARDAKQGRGRKSLYQVQATVSMEQ